MADLGSGMPATDSSTTADAATADELREESIESLSDQDFLVREGHVSLPSGADQDCLRVGGAQSLIERGATLAEVQLAGRGAVVRLRYAVRGGILERDAAARSG